MSTVYIAENSLSCTKDELSFMKSLIPEYRTERAEKYRLEADRNNCIISYFLLLYGLNADYGIKRIPPIVYGSYGKPAFEYFNVHFSISHSGESVCCGISEKGMGADIQEIVTDYSGLAENVLSEKEMELLKNSDNPSLCFTKLWTLKEAYLKYKGTGLNDCLSDCDFSEVYGNCHEYRGICFRTENTPDYCISGCSYSETPVFVKKSIGEYINEYSRRLQRFNE